MAGDGGAPDELLAEQLQYYRARADEYDEWWDRRGRYDRGPAASAAWFRERATVESALDELDLRGDVLELAAGTGIWTRRLALSATSVTALDASPEMIAVNRRRVGAAPAKVRYLVADLFAWEPDRTYDAVAFCFWLSHVPRDRLAPFAALVAAGLRPGGALFFVDGRREPTSTAVDHVLPSPDDEVMTRRLNDGTAFRVVKNFWAPAELEDLFRTAGLAVRVRETPRYFQYGTGVRA
jgi:2-polyprenyl-3-methyl-5-hydroxy-6-metoxy-1,4-benzoquinol methylase